MTQTAGSTTKSPELLARYCDALLRKGYVRIVVISFISVWFYSRSKAVEEIDLEEKFNQIMVYTLPLDHLSFDNIL